MGGGIVYRFRSDKPEQVKTELEKVLGYPITSNVLGRFVKVSDYGIREDINKELRMVRSHQDDVSLTAHEAVEKMLAGKELSEKEKEALIARIDNIQGYLTRGIANRYGNVYMEKLLSARSNDEKMIVLNRMLADPFITRAREGETMTATGKPAPQPKKTPPLLPTSRAARYAAPRRTTLEGLAPAPARTPKESTLLLEEMGKKTKQ